MKKLLLALLALSATIALAAAGDRFISNPTQDKDILLQVNKGGVTTTAVQVTGSTGAVSIKGATDGAFASSGNIGEEIKTSCSSQFSANSGSAPVLGTYYDVTGCTVTVPAGRWELTAQIPAQLSWVSGASTLTTISGAIRTGSSTVVAVGSGFIGESTTVTTAMLAPIWAIETVSVTSSTTYKVSIMAYGWSGSPTLGTLYYRGDVIGGYIKARRIP